MSLIVFVDFMLLILLYVLLLAMALRLIKKCFKNLGITMDEPSFSHPCDFSVNVYGICDVCHMLKLVRNALADLKILRDAENREIKWSYIKHLVDVQDTAGIRDANKVNGNHINVHKHKMKVKLASQVLSKSVADALDLLRIEIGDFMQLENEATVQFVRVFVHLFDILNSHSPFAKGPKSPLRLGNLSHWKFLLTSFKDYITSLNSADGMSLLQHRRKTAFVGFVLNINSVLRLASDLLERTVNPFIYFSIYKLSQDHLDLFLSKIRLRGGFNNNPSVTQFKAAFRSLILKNCVAPSLNANCTSFEAMKII